MASHGVLLMLFCCALFTASFSSSASKNTKGLENNEEFIEKIIVRNLLRQYARSSVYGRPVRNHWQAVEVKFGLTLIDILSVSPLGPRAADVALFVYQKMEWRDQLLEWRHRNQRESPQSVSVPIRQIWRPDMLLYNSLDTKADVNENLMAVVHHDGFVSLVEPSIYRVRCPRGKTESSWDCMLKIGSWTKTEEQLDPQLFEYMDGMDVREFVPLQFNVSSLSVRRVSKEYSCCPEVFVHLEYNCTVSVIN